jgi:hypothetical protein
MIFCTLTTASHLHKCTVLAKSLEQFGYKLFVCQIDKTTTDTKDFQFNFENIELSALGEEVGVLKRRYNQDRWRWALKPILMRYLLTTTTEKVVYVDNDFYFFSSPNEVNEQLDKFDILLTPHDYCHVPNDAPNWFEANYRVGLFNAGFVAVNAAGLPFLDWWIKCCAYNMKKSFWRGLYDDQKYLDLVPIKFKKVKILDTRKFNIAAWNDWQFDKNVAEKKEIVCIHFADLSMRTFADPAHFLHAFYLSYVENLSLSAPVALHPQKNKFDLRRIPELIYFMRWKIVRIFEK